MPRIEEPIALRDERLYREKRRRDGQNIVKSLASLDPWYSPPTVDYEHDHDKILPPDHPGRQAEEATKPEQHAEAAAYHKRRAEALSPGMLGESHASRSHEYAARVHDLAAKTKSDIDSSSARQASSWANRAEYEQTTAIGR